MIALSHAFILIAQKAHKIRQDIYLPDLPLFVTHQFCAFIAQHCKQKSSSFNCAMYTCRHLDICDAQTIAAIAADQVSCTETGQES